MAKTSAIMGILSIAVCIIISFFTFHLGIQEGAAHFLLMVAYLICYMVYHHSIFNLAAHYNYTGEFIPLFFLPSTTYAAISVLCMSLARHL